MPEIREVAHRVIFGKTLAEKLLHAPKKVTDSKPGSAIVTPKFPQRPFNLRVSNRKGRQEFPSIYMLESLENRAKMLHFLANHELLATELMALVLLKFPLAPVHFRQGVYQTMLDEQAHTLMYMRRLETLGFQFGDFPVNDYFWRMIAPMANPMDFVVRLSLTFEQANLDFAYYYKDILYQLGDRASGNILNKIYRDEIQHVNHGLIWFRQWKNPSLNDWEAFSKALGFPLNAARAKSSLLFNEQGRRDAGLSEDFIQQLKIYAASKNSPPCLHWFNPNAEYLLLRSSSCELKQSQRSFATDLAILPLFYAKPTDVCVVPKNITPSHLHYLQDRKIPLVACVTPEQAKVYSTRKLQRCMAWAYTTQQKSELVDYLSQCKYQSPWQEISMSQDQLRMSKKMGYLLQQKLPTNVTVSTAEFTCVKKLLVAIEKRNVIVKCAYGVAGRQNRIILAKDKAIAASDISWLTKKISSHKALFVEDFVDKVLGFAVHYQITAQQEIKYIGVTVNKTTAGGHFIAAIAQQKIHQLFSTEVRQFLFYQDYFTQLFTVKIPAICRQVMTAKKVLLSDSAFSIDAMVYRNEQNKLALHAIMEANMRTTFGRVAFDLLKKTATTQNGSRGELRIWHRRESEANEMCQRYKDQVTTGLQDNMLFLNDPLAAEQFFATWQLNKVT